MLQANSKEYVLNHDYGYGKEPEQENLNKLELRNSEDLKVYVNDVIANAFVATYKRGVVVFKGISKKTRIVIEKV